MEKVEELLTDCVNWCLGTEAGLAVSDLTGALSPLAAAAAAAAAEAAVGPPDVTLARLQPHLECVFLAFNASAPFLH